MGALQRRLGQARKVSGQTPTLGMLCPLICLHVWGSVVVLLIEDPQGEASPHCVVIHLPIEAEKHPGQAEPETRGHPLEGAQPQLLGGGISQRELDLSHPLV